MASILGAYQALNEPFAQQAKDNEAQFLEDCAFAKVVSTARGDALLIQGKVIFLEGPDSWGYANLISKALRRASGSTGSADGQTR